MNILVTGAAGFIGSNFLLEWLEQSNEPAVNLDLLTYAGNLENLKELEGDPRCQFVLGNISDRELVRKYWPIPNPVPASTLRPKATSIVRSMVRGVCQSRCPNYLIGQLRY